MLTQEADVQELYAEGITWVHADRTSGKAPGEWFWTKSGHRSDVTLPVNRIEDGLTTFRSMKTALQELQAREGGEYVLQLEDFECSEVPAKKFLALASEILDDRFVVVSLDDRKLPWKGKEKCLKCGFKVDDWSAKKRLCDGCRGSLKKTDRVNGGTWRKGNFSVSD